MTPLLLVLQSVKSHIRTIDLNGKEIEKLILLDEVDLTEFCGVSNNKLEQMRRGFPHINIVVRGAWMKVTGDAQSVAEFDEKMSNLLAYYHEHNVLPEETIKAVIDGERVIVKPTDASIIVHTVEGKPVKPRGVNQQKMVESAEVNDMVFAVGPAGSGKTYLAIALAVKALKAKQVRKIILSRPAVEAGEKLGFLPGDIKEKIDPYLQPLYDALEDMISASRLKEMLENGVIEIAPLAFMRGRTLSHAFVILDEAQNTTLPQIKMFLTRMGSGSKFIITGDPSQVDLPDGQKNGLLKACEILSNVKGIGVIQFDQGDIVRHKLVQRIVSAFEKSGSK